MSAAGDLSRIQDAVHVERRRLHAGLAQHYVNLAAMVGLVVEHVQYTEDHRVDAVPPFTVGVCNGAVG